MAKKEEPLTTYPTHDVGTSAPYDAVFGELNEDGPNYRNVSEERMDISSKCSLLTNAGRMAWINRFDDEDADGSWCPLTASCV